MEYRIFTAVNQQALTYGMQKAGLLKFQQASPVYPPGINVSWMADQLSYLPATPPDLPKVDPAVPAKACVLIGVEQDKQDPTKVWTALTDTGLGIDTSAVPINQFWGGSPAPEAFAIWAIEAGLSKTGQAANWKLAVVAADAARADVDKKTCSAKWARVQSVTLEEGWVLDIIKEVRTLNGWTVKQRNDWIDALKSAARAAS